MADVWRAHDEQLDRLVAVRILHRHLLPDERTRSRFAAEARAIAAVTHPGLVAVHDVQVDDRQAVLVQELVVGERLTGRLARAGRVSEVAAAAIVAQVAQAVQAVHDRGIVHRDIKPANVLLSPDGRVRLVDFGIARTLDEREATLMVPGTIMATIRYLPPEGLAGAPADRTGDIFGLGSLLFETLIGRPPFPATTPPALKAEQRTGAPAMHGGSQELAGLARTALQPNPELRPRTAGRMAIMLERWLSNRGLDISDMPALTAGALAGSPPRVQAAASTGPGSADRLDGDALAGAGGPPLAGAEGRTASVVGASTGPKAGGTVGLLASGPRRLAGRRVPLVTAIGLAGVLLVGLLLTGSLAGLQATTSKPSPSVPASVTLQPTPTPRPTPTPSPTPTPTPTLPGSITPVHRTPGPSQPTRPPGASPTPRSH
jgi:hypothetical protein